MDLEELKQALNSIENKFSQIKEALNIDVKRDNLKELENQTLQPGFWDNQKLQEEVLSKMKTLKAQVEKIDKLSIGISDACGYYELAIEMQDLDSFKEAQKLVSVIEENLEKLEMSTLLFEEYDINNAIITIHPGAGGTESQDWALMLYRMYIRWIQKSELEYEILDMQEADDAGLKSVSILVKGDNAYGYLKGESGVHRLVRISPFDSNSRRHTSFAAVEVLPEIADNVELEIDKDDIQMDVFRASGAGGQHVNKTSSAVRLKHIPTGIVVTCQTERSQLQNRENCMKMLRAKLYKKQQDEHKQKLNNLKGETLDNAWGSQIRSYVFCPYTLVKDHRTNFEVGNVNAVMDGKLDDFIYEYLKHYSKLNNEE